jgi:hypothetical protein
MNRVQTKSYQINMKISIFTVVFLLIISCVQAISNEDQNKSLIQRNEQTREINGTISLPFVLSILSTNFINVSNIYKLLVYFFFTFAFITCVI